ncbi:MAG: NAD(P)/FAD-dependent oxidoreductase [Magnetococcales bacterium]|nr:NAD(P)/FAD-dependent oxidoreductase [Magnetococcales bacterium]
MIQADVVIIGAGAAGLMCAMTAGQRGRRAVVVDHNRYPGQKVRVAGGGHANFTNLHLDARHYQSAAGTDPNFCAAALARFRPDDYISLVNKHGIAWYEKQQGQLFCTGSAQQLVDLLLREGERAGVRYQMQNPVRQVRQQTGKFTVVTATGSLTCDSLVVATGGLSLPKIGASDLGYRLAVQFGLSVVPVQPALVALLCQNAERVLLAGLAGISLPRVQVCCRGHCFVDAMLFTHKGLSGPAILQISSFWRPQETIVIDLVPDRDLAVLLKQAKVSRPKQELLTALAVFLPRRLALAMIQMFGHHDLASRRLAEIGDRDLSQLAQSLHHWEFCPADSDGYRTAEVTLGGVDTRELDPETLMSRRVPGLYFIGEVVDVTGQLGGFNLHWAWASGYAAGLSV